MWREKKQNCLNLFPLWHLQRVPSTLLIFEGLRIRGYSGPLVKSVWVTGFIQLELIPLLSFSFHSVKIWLDILGQDTPYKLWSWNFNHSKGSLMTIQYVMLCWAQTTEVFKILIDYEALWISHTVKKTSKLIPPPLIFKWHKL